MNRKRQPGGGPLMFPNIAPAPRGDTPQIAAYLEGYEGAQELGNFDPSMLLGLLPAVGPIIQGISGLFGGGGAGGGAAAPNPFAQLLGVGGTGAGAGAGAQGALSGLLGLLGGGAGAAGAAGGKGGVDPAAALMAANLARNPQTDPATAGVLAQVAQKGAQDDQAKRTREEVSAAVNPELQAIKGQVEQLQRDQRERERAAAAVRQENFQRLVLSKLNTLLSQGPGGGERRY